MGQNQQALDQGNPALSCLVRQEDNDPHKWSHSLVWAPVSWFSTRIQFCFCKLLGSCCILLHHFVTDRVEVSTVKEQLKFIKSELARTEETTRVLEGMLARLA